MWASKRGEVPPKLAAQGPELCAAYQARRSTTPDHRFEWSKSLRAELIAALLAMTQKRCSYCDGDLRLPTVLEEIDHFKPKTRAEFYALVCSWENLFITCPPCNRAKGSQWSDLLLKPDDLEYCFERYFSYSSDIGELSPSKSASPGDQERAKVTIKLLNLNREKLCTARTNALEELKSLPPAEWKDLSYRYLHHSLAPVL